MAKEFLEDQLKSPSMAKYPFSHRDHVTRSGDTYTINAWVDAQNSFGATLRQNWSARLTYTGGSNWSCDYLSLDGDVLIDR